MADPIGGGTFSKISYNPTLRRDYRVAINSQPWVTRSPQLVISNYLKASKFLGYAALNPSVGALAASKFLGYAALNPSVGALAASKFLGYAVLQPSPMAIGRTDFMWPNPRGRPFPQDLRGYLQGSPIDLGIVPPPNPPVLGYETPNPRLRSVGRIDWQQGLNPNLAVSQAPFYQTDWPNPRQRVQARLDWQREIGPNAALVAPFAQHDWPNPLRRRLTSGGHTYTLNGGYVFTPPFFQLFTG